MILSETFVVSTCPKCDGTGVYRNARHFFYGICLIASGIMCFFHWPPTPGLFAAVGDFGMRLGMPAWVTSVGIWVLTGLPPVFGVAFIYAWFAQDTCPACLGRRKATRVAPQ
ncbi:MAG: hypothetical protein JXQ75_21710 [Phycisphaerae bacterium]|nr:hypothetical protein [Phycisphaerae bacterium]